MSRYAENTQVNAEKSRGEIERTLQRYGARTLIEDRGYLTPCWVWTGTLHDQGYGVVRINGRRHYMHRLAVEIADGPIPDGMTVDHLCRVRPCWNPDHLEIVTRGENVLRGEGPRAVAWRNGTCFRGHPMSGDNLYVSPGGHRQCRRCRQRRERGRTRG